MKIKVLLIEDDKYLREVVEVCLQELGHEVVSTENGPEGIEKCDDSFHLVITDRHMPGGMLGEEVIYRIKKLYPEIRAILITADDLDESTRQAIKAAGAEEILLKPLDLDKIEQLLRVTPQSNSAERR